MFKYEFYGTSHSRYIGCSVYNIPSNFVIDSNYIKNSLKKRTSSFSFNTSRVEQDVVIFIDGVKDNIIYKDNFSFVIENKNVATKDYLKGIIRPSHADYIGYIKEGDDYDYSGGGRFSGRLTALYVVLGSIISFNKNYGEVYSHISYVHGHKDDDIRNKTLDQLNNLDDKFPVFNLGVKEKMLSLINIVSKNGDSIGGELTYRIDNVKFGVGGYNCNSFESILSKHIYSVGAVKGVLFGLGREYLDVLGSQANDSYLFTDGKVVSKDNKQGGINGGFANGYESVIFSVIIRPTPTIFMEQKTIKYNNGTFENVTYKARGRHDSFIVNRINQVIKSVIYIAFLELESLK